MSSWRAGKPRPGPRQVEALHRRTKGAGSRGYPQLVHAIFPMYSNRDDHSKVSRIECRILSRKSQLLPDAQVLRLLQQRVTQRNVAQ